jgi:hypothetical protein
MKTEYRILDADGNEIERGTVRLPETPEEIALEEDFLESDTDMRFYVPPSGGVN